jgi:hypothetical protein
VVMQMERNPSALGKWLTDLSERKHRNVTVVALANKMARIAWALLTRGPTTRLLNWQLHRTRPGKDARLRGLGNRMRDSALFLASGCDEV